jgi:hypothetical protein
MPDNLQASSNVNTNPETRPGVKTTEFLVTIAAAVLPFIDLVGLVELLPDRYAAIALAIISALYSVSRGLAKQNIPNVPYRPDPQNAPAVDGTTLVVPDPESKL